MTKTLHRSLWTLALAMLVAVSIFVNRPTAQTQASPADDWSSDAPTGNAVDQQLADFTMTKTDGEEFHLADERGKVVFLNLWATWCTPCVNELPCFDGLAAAYPDDVTVLAIHSDLITDDVQAYLSRFDYQIGFAIDETGDIVKLLGGTTMLPQTLVLDRHGVVIYNQVGSVTDEALEALARMADPKLPARADAAE